LKTGDRVRFIIESNAGALQIVNIQKANWTGQPQSRFRPQEEPRREKAGKKR
jgi:hypothetical protein